MNPVAQVYAPTMEKVYQALKKGGETANENVIITYLNWQNAKQAQQARTERLRENFRVYAAIYNELGLGMWPEKAVAYMLAQHRQILTYNFAKPIVDRIAGGFLEMTYDPEFHPIDSEVTTLTEYIKEAMYSDKEKMDWHVAIKELIEHGLICEGVIKPYISTEYDDLGNIGYEACTPGSVIPDPMWRTPRSKDCRIAWHEQWFMPDDLLNKWGDKCPQLETEVAAIRAAGRQYGENQGVLWGTTDQDRWGSAIRIVSEYRTIDRKYKDEYVVTGEGKHFIPRELPDAAAKIEYLNRSLGEDGWEPDQVFETPVTERVCVVKRIAPSVSWNTVIEEGETEWQTGALPFHWWSPSRVNGEPLGIIDSIKDANQTINYLNSLITHKWQTEGGGGSQFVDRSKFANDEEYERYTTNRHDPTETFEVRDDALSSGGPPALPTMKSEFPREAYEQLNHLISVVLPNISKSSPAHRGMQEDSNQSGYLYSLITKQADLALYSMHFGLRLFHNELYEGFFKQAAKLYANEQVERIFTRAGNKGIIKLNERVQYADGRIGIKNDVRQLRYIRHKIIISETQDSPTQKIHNLRAIGEFIKSLPPTKAAMINYLTTKQAALVPGLTPDDREILEQLGDYDLRLVIADAEAKTAQAELAMLQAREQIEAIKNKPPALPQPGGPLPPGAPLPIDQSPPMQPQAPSGMEPINSQQPQAEGEMP